MAYPNAGVTVDGSFGVQTLAFVLLYQVDHGLSPDGIVGPETRKHLDPVESAMRKVAAAQELSAFNQDLADIDRPARPQDDPAGDRSRHEDPDARRTSRPRPRAGDQSSSVDR